MEGDRGKKCVVSLKIIFSATLNNKEIKDILGSVFIAKGFVIFLLH